MKKKGILNSEISKEISQLGHTDKIMIADCGLPIPQDVRRIDISLKAGTPSFYDVYKVLKEELIIEKQFLAKEIKNENKQLHNFIKNDFETEYLSHEQLKELSKQCKFILRTGEMTPYANVILQSGVNFEEIYEHTSY